MLRFLVSRSLRASDFPQIRSFSQIDKQQTLTDKLKCIFNPEVKRKLWEPEVTIPQTSDVVVIGGGVMGSSIAYWLKKTVYKDSCIVVIERDPTYTKASTSLSVGGLRQQFSLKENIQMSLYGAEFLRKLNTHLAVQGEPPIDVNFHPYGYLLLATANGAQTLMENSKLQNSMGAKNILLTPQKLKNLFPWINVDNIELACLGLEKEGWFDPWSLLCAFRRKALSLGVQYIHAEAVGFEKEKLDEDYVTYSGGMTELRERITSVIIDTPDGNRHAIKFAAAVISAGAFSGELAKKAGIGVGSGIRGVPLPVEPRKRFVYCFHCPGGPGLNTPLTVDTTGTYFRRDGLAGNYICGRSPSPNEEPAVDDLSVDHEYFDEKIWPVLAGRVKAFEDLKVKSSWAGYYEYNTYDRNGIIGVHPYYTNLCIATGFSGHGIQQAPAVGRAVAELIFYKEFTSIDLTRLGFNRFIDDTPILERNIV